MTFTMRNACNGLFLRSQFPAPSQVMHPNKPQFTLRSIALLLSIIGVYLAIFRVLTPEWRFLMGVATFGLGASLASMYVTRPWSRIPGWCMLFAVSLVSAWYLWRGLYPDMYYMEGWALTIVLWGGVLAGCLSMMAASLAASDRKPRSLSRCELAFVIIPFATTLLLAFQIPLRIGAAIAVPTLAQTASEPDLGAGRELPCGLYTFRLPANRGTAEKPVFYRLSRDGESAFVYSPLGIDKIVYNSGSKGRLFGDWYWIKED